MVGVFLLAFAGNIGRQTDRMSGRQADKSQRERERRKEGRDGGGGGGRVGRSKSRELTPNNLPVCR